MKLTDEEQKILDGSKGEVMAKVKASNDGTAEVGW